MDLGSVRVKIEGDPTKLQADLKAAEAAAANAGGKIAEAFNKSAGSIKDAQNAVKAATLNMTEAAKAFGPAAATGNKAAVSSLKLYETELKTAQAELARFTKQQATSATSASKPPSFVGAIPGFGVAAERFIGMVPGFGDTLTSLFPLFGATAFLAVIDRIAPKILEAAEAFDPMTRATERAKKAAEDYDDVIKKLGADIKELNADALEFALGKSAAGAIGSAEKTQDQRASQGMVKLLREELAQYEAIAKTKLAAANAPANPYDEGGGQLLVAAKESKAANLDVETARKRLTAFEAQAAKDEAEASQKIRKSLVQGVDDRKKASADLAQLGEKESRRKQQEEDEEERNAAKRQKRIDELVAAQKLIIDSERKFNDAMDEQKQRWKKINIDAKDQRVTQSKIDVPLAARVGEAFAGPNELKENGILTVDMRKAAIAEDQRLLNMSELMNVPLGTQLQLRERILQKQIDLKAAQGQSVDNELIGLRKLQDQQDRMRQSPKATLHSGLSSVAGTDQTLGTKMSVTGVQLAAGMVDGLASTLARAAVEGGKLGHMLRDVGKQLAMTAATSVLKMGLQAALQGILKLIPAFAGVATAQVGAAATSHAATSALNVASVMSYAAVGAAAAAAATAAIPIIGPALAPGVAAAIYGQISSFAPLAAFADGGRPEPGKMAIVGERGPELFIPDQAGRIVPNNMLMGGAGLSFPSASAGGNSVGSMSFHAYGMTNPEKFVDYVAHRLPDRIKKTSARFAPAASR
tara:strand:+ start:3097 stop:5358 length:2262 start_codon:yes stop_codon:yes gene_type:complete